MIKHTDSKVHWSFFIALEQDVEVMTRYIEPVEANHNVFSLELCRILFAAASECEVVLKELAKRFDPDAGNHNIIELQKTILANVPELASEKIFVPRYGLDLDPWANWRSAEVPEWWSSYNKVKHQRATHYSEGNLKNALNAVAALKIATVCYYHYCEPPKPELKNRLSFTLWKLSPQSRLFFLDRKFYPVGIMSIG